MNKQTTLILELSPVSLTWGCRLLPPVFQQKTCVSYENMLRFLYETQICVP